MKKFVTIIRYVAVSLMVSVGASTQYDAMAAEPDSMNVELKEVSVEAAMQKTTPTTTTYIPDKRVKRAAQNAIDLLRLSAIPQIVVSPQGGGVSTVGGQGIDIYINYTPASNEDIQGLRTTDVRRIEYLDYPTDPRFRNAQHVVNIIVAEYEYGGYTKLSAAQWVLGSQTTKGSVFSKFAYKKVTYDFYAGLDRVDSKHVNSANYSSFKLPSGTIERDQTPLSSKFAYYTLPVTLRMSYSTDKIQIRNTFGYSFMNRHENEQIGRLTFTPDMGSDYEFRSSSPYRTSSLTWYGNYYFALPSNWQLSVDPSVAYSHNDSYSDYSTTISGSDPIVNNAKEDAYQLRLTAKVAKQINRHNINFSLDGGTHINDIDYLGSNPFHTKFSNTYCDASVGYALNLDMLYLNADGGVIGEFQRTNGIKYDDWYPFAHLSATYAWNQKNQAQLWVQYATSSPGASMRTPGVLQSNELLYTSGNPDLDNARHTTVNASYTFMPTNKFMATLYGQYYGLYDRSVAVYGLHDGGDGILQSYINSGDYLKTDVGANFVLRLLKNSMVFQVMPTYSNYHSTGYIRDTRNVFNCTLAWQYYVGSFNFSAYYATRGHSLNSTTGAYSTNRSYYNFQIGWANSDWSVRLTADNIFRTRYDYGWNVMTSPLYSRTGVTYNANRRATMSLSATYTFGYGKKLKRGNEVGAQSGSSSAIME